MRHWFRSYYILLVWTMRRMRHELPTFFVVQSMLSMGVILGFSFLVPEINQEVALYLSTGAVTVALITTSMVMAPQMISYQKQQGVFDYQRSLPVPRMAMLSADATTWSAMAVPGMTFAMLIAVVRFDLKLEVSPLLLPAVVLVIAGAVGIGYTLAYALKPTLVGMVTQVIIVIALMFAPINYPAERLPNWLANVHEWLPFQYMAQAVRDTMAVPPHGIAVVPFVVLAAWSVLGLTVAGRVMSRRP